MEVCCEEYIAERVTLEDNIRVIIKKNHPFSSTDLYRRLVDVDLV